MPHIRFCVIVKCVSDVGQRWRFPMYSNSLIEHKERVFHWLRGAYHAAFHPLSLSRSRIRADKSRSEREPIKKIKPTHNINIGSIMKYLYSRGKYPMLNRWLGVFFRRTTDDWLWPKLIFDILFLSALSNEYNDKIIGSARYTQLPFAIRIGICVCARRTLCAAWRASLLPQHSNVSTDLKQMPCIRWRCSALPFAFKWYRIWI